MVYKIKYDEEADVLMVVVAEEGKLSYAEEVGDLIVHFDEDNKPLFIEVLRASRIVPLMVQSLAKKEVSVT
jgi:uncharacterized protein YuzE